jgi:hypothetical protein
MILFPPPCNGGTTGSVVEGGAPSGSLALMRDLAILSLKGRVDVWRPACPTSRREEGRESRRLISLPDTGSEEFCTF